MVDVRATNAKLVGRSFALEQDVTGAPDAAASAALNDAKGEVKTAIAVILAGASAADERSRLDAAAGSLRAVISRPSLSTFPEKHSNDQSQQLAQRIFETIGGSATIADVENCMTRLRVEVVFTDGVALDDFKATDRVMAAIAAGSNL